MRDVCSMTGFASVRGTAADGTAFHLSAKSVNHRFLDLQFRFPGGMDALEMGLRQRLKARLRRGHVDVTLHVERAGEELGGIDDDALSRAIAEFRAAASRHGLTQEPDLHALLRLPGVMGGQRATTMDHAGLEAAVSACGEELIDALMASRAGEGAALVAELRASMERVRAMSVEVGELRAGVREAQFARLRERLGELLKGTDVAEERVLMEAAMLAERSDVDEENVRLLTHADRFVAMVEEGGEVGKRLDFLLQELNREANTMLSKTSGAAGGNGLRLTELGLAMKAEIERAKEQVQNLE